MFFRVTSYEFVLGAAKYYSGYMVFFLVLRRREFHPPLLFKYIASLPQASPILIIDLCWYMPFWLFTATPKHHESFNLSSIERVAQVHVSVLHWVGYEGLWLYFYSLGLVESCLDILSRVVIFFEIHLIRILCLLSLRASYLRTMNGHPSCSVLAVLSMLLKFMSWFHIE